MANNLQAAGAATVRAEMVRMRYDDNGGGAAGTYSASVIVPANAVLIDVILHSVTIWNSGTSATGIVGDVTDDNGIFDAIDMNATDLLATEGLSVALAGGKAGADIANSQFNRRRLATQRTITLKVTTVGVTSTGETWMTVVYAIESGETVKTATFVAT